MSVGVRSSGNCSTVSFLMLAPTVVFSSTVGLAAVTVIASVTPDSFNFVSSRVGTPRARGILFVTLCMPSSPIVMV